MNLTIEQKKEILDNAPTGATHFKKLVTAGYYKVKEINEPFGKTLTADFWDKYNSVFKPSVTFKMSGAIALEDLLADVIAHEATEEEMKNIDSILVESDEALATEMSERDIPSFDDPIFVSPLDACANNEADFDNTPQQVESLAKEVECNVSDECVYTELRHIGDRVHNISCSIESETIQELLGKVSSTLWRIKKPESLQEKAKREREENGKALFELRLSFADGVDGCWEKLTDSTREGWRQFAELVTLKDEHKE